jgi:hypothetical protein
MIGGPQWNIELKDGEEIEQNSDGTAVITHADGSHSYVARNGNVYEEVRKGVPQ